jgi:hypothetical protein
MQRLPYPACHAVRLSMWFPVGLRSASGPAGLNFYRVRLSPRLARTEAKPEPKSQRLDFSGTLRKAPDGLSGDVSAPSQRMSRLCNHARSDVTKQFATRGKTDESACVTGLSRAK